jgi:DNA polymerase-3 subunit delta'
MSKAPRSAAASAEADCFPGALHPVMQPRLVGHLQAQEQFLEAASTGRLPHAWLIGGPEGTGKATLAYRLARWLLSPPEARTGPGVETAPDSRPVRQIIAGAHPDLAVLRRVPEKEGAALPTVISVDQVRRVLERVHQTSSEGGNRVCIVDTADELNANGANALLKTIEEPPRNTYFLLISHAPGRLLPTIRSRCRRLTLQPLARSEVQEVLGMMGQVADGHSAEDLSAVAARAEGSVRKALTLLDPQALGVVRAVEGLLASLPRLDHGAILKLGDMVNGRQNRSEFAIALDVVAAHVRSEIGRRAGEGAASLAPLIEVWDKAQRSAREADVFHLDRRPLILELFSGLAQAMPAPLPG